MLVQVPGRVRHHGLHCLPLAHDRCNPPPPPLPSSPPAPAPSPVLCPLLLGDRFGRCRPPARPSSRAREDAHAPQPARVRAIGMHRTASRCVAALSVVHRAPRAGYLRVLLGTTGYCRVLLGTAGYSLPGTGGYWRVLLGTHCQGRRHRRSPMFPTCSTIARRHFQSPADCQVALAMSIDYSLFLLSRFRLEIGPACADSRLRRFPHTPIPTYADSRLRRFPLSRFPLAPIPAHADSHLADSHSGRFPLRPIPTYADSHLRRFTLRGRFPLRADSHL
jgi:hypothetical protein